MESKLLIYAAFIFLLASFANSEKYFVLDVNYIAGSLTFNSINLKEVDRAMKYTDDSGFLIKLKSFDNADMQNFYYSMTANKNYQIYVPYSKNAARIEVYNPSSSKVMDIEVSSFADTCGNKICEDYESYESCTKDCSSGSKDDFCDSVNDGICDPDCSFKTDTDCEDKKTDNSTTTTPPITQNKKQQPKITPKKLSKSPDYLLWSSIISAVVVIPALIFAFLRIKKKQAIINTLKQYISQNMQRGFTLQQIKNVLYQQGYSESEIDKAVRNI